MNIRCNMALALIALLLAADATSAENDDHIALQADERLTLDGSAIESPVSFFLTGGTPPILLFPISRSALKSTRTWQIQIRNSDGRKVSYIQGTGVPSSPVIFWSGLSMTGEPLPDGFYDTQFLWTDARGLHQTAVTKVSLLTPPSIRNLYSFQLKLDYTAEGLVVRIPDIMFFDLGQSHMSDEALPALRAIVDFLKSSPENKVDVRGYTDSSGSPNGNLILSRQRARAVLDFLAANGIDPARLTSQGLGPQRPIASNATPRGRATNRRVEVVGLKAGA